MISNSASSAAPVHRFVRHRPELLVDDFAIDLYPFGFKIQCRELNGVVFRCKRIINTVSIGSRVKGLGEEDFINELRQIANKREAHHGPFA